MSDIPVSQILFVVVMGILLLIVVPVFETRTGKSLTEIFFGIRRKPRAGQENGAAPKKEPRINNGTKGELLSFLSRMIRFANKNGMQMVVPGSVVYKGETSRLSALLVTPGGVIGLYCLGFGGKITGTKDPAPWKQHINGEDRTFENPVKICREQQKLVQSAMEEAGISGHVDVVTVFTNARATLYSIPSGIYSQSSFMDHIKSTSSLRNGDLDVARTAQALAVLADVKTKKNAARKKK